MKTGTRKPNTSGETTPPMYLTADEVADLLRTTKGAIYTMVQRKQLPGVRRLGRRILVRRAALLRWIESQRDGAELRGGDN